jgi:hypothetical protein
MWFPTFAVPSIATGVWGLGLGALAVVAVGTVFTVFGFVVIRALAEVRAGRSAFVELPEARPGRAADEPPERRPRRARAPLRPDSSRFGPSFGPAS